MHLIDKVESPRHSFWGRVNCTRRPHTTTGAPQDTQACLPRVVLYDGSASINPGRNRSARPSCHHAINPIRNTQCDRTSVAEAPWLLLIGHDLLQKLSQYEHGVESVDTMGRPVDVRGGQLPPYKVSLESSPSSGAFTALTGLLCSAKYPGPLCSATYPGPFFVSSSHGFKTQRPRRSSS